MVWKNTRNAFSKSVIKSSIHSVKVVFMGKSLSTVPEWKMGSMLKQVSYKHQEKMSKQQGLCNSQRTAILKENRILAQMKDDSFSCVGRLSDQKIDLNCQWKPGLFLAANTSIESLSGVAEHVLHGCIWMAQLSGRGRGTPFQCQKHFWFYLHNRRRWAKLWGKSCITCH